MGSNHGGMTHQRAYEPDGGKHNYGLAAKLAADALVQRQEIDHAGENGIPDAGLRDIHSRTVPLAQLFATLALADAQREANRLEHGRQEAGAELGDLLRAAQNAAGL